MENETANKALDVIVAITKDRDAALFQAAGLREALTQVSTLAGNWQTQDQIYDIMREALATPGPTIGELQELRSYRDEVEAAKPTVQALLNMGEVATSDRTWMRDQLISLQAANRWRPIAEAPRDNTGIEAIDSRTGFVRVVDYYKGYPPNWIPCWVLQGASNECYPLDYFTHYRPIPYLPEAQDAR